MRQEQDVLRCGLLKGGGLRILDGGVHDSQDVFVSVG